MALKTLVAITSLSREGPIFLERPPGNLLAYAQRINIRRIKKIDPGFDRTAIERTRFRILQHPLTPLLRAIGHGPEADSGNFQASRAKIHVFH